MATTHDTDMVDAPDHHQMQYSGVFPVDRDLDHKYSWMMLGLYKTDDF